MKLGRMMLNALHMHAYDQKTDLWTLSTAMRTEPSTLDFWISAGFTAELQRNNRYQIVELTQALRAPSSKMPFTEGYKKGWIEKALMQSAEQILDQPISISTDPLRVSPGTQQGSSSTTHSQPNVTDGAV
jgi:hypothetical protein